MKVLGSDYTGQLNNIGAIEELEKHMNTFLEAEIEVLYNDSQELLISNFSVTKNEITIKGIESGNEILLKVTFDAIELIQDVDTYIYTFMRHEKKVLNLCMYDLTLVME